MIKLTESKQFCTMVLCVFSTRRRKNKNVVKILVLKKDSALFIQFQTFSYQISPFPNSDLNLAKWFQVYLISYVTLQTTRLFYFGAVFCTQKNKQKRITFYLTHSFLWRIRVLFEEGNKPNVCERVFQSKNLPFRLIKEYGLFRSPEILRKITFV